MNPDSLRRRVGSPNAGAFATTQWSVVLSAGCSDSNVAHAAMAQLCERYWYPLYAYLRQRNRSSEDAEDLVQGFFERVLQSHWLDRVTPERGRFRSWLLASLRHHLADERDRDRALKRGGGAPVVSLDALDAEARFQSEPADPRTPEQLYDRRWALTVLREALSQLRADYNLAGKSSLFEALQPTLPGGSGQVRYDDLGSSLGMTEGAVKVAVHRLRHRYRDLVRRVVAETLESPELVDSELEHMMSALGNS